MLRALFLFALIFFVHSKIYFEETFDDNWRSRWVESDVKKADGTAGTWVHTAGEFFNDEARDSGIKTNDDAKFYQISSLFRTPFDRTGKDVVVFYTVKYEQSPDCGGAYLKLGAPGLDQSSFHGETPYALMFGPDVCGSTKRTHFILNHGEHNHLLKKDVTPLTDQKFTHSYKAVLHADNSYELFIDGESKSSGSLLDGWDVIPPATIPDPAATKPADWVDAELMDDPDDVKPADWDAEPAEVPDADAARPADWDEELDGEWEPPMVPNPNYKGEWRAKRVKNPAYVGPWKAPTIANPEFKEGMESEVGKFTLGWVGVEVWQVKSGSVIGNVVVSDAVEDVEKYETYVKELRGVEEAQKKEKEEKTRAEAEERRKKAQEEKGEEEEEEHHVSDEL